MRFNKDVLFPILLATGYFVVVYFTTAALFPALALQAGLLAVILAMSAYLFLRATGNTETGIPVGLLIMLPFSCLVAGVIWWLLRLLGFWEDLTQGKQQGRHRCNNERKGRNVGGPLAFWRFGPRPIANLLN